MARCEWNYGGGGEGRLVFSRPGTKCEKKRTNRVEHRVLKGRWLRKMRGVGKNTVIQVLYGIAAIEGYLQFERVLSL